MAQSHTVCDLAIGNSRTEDSKDILYTDLEEEDDTY